MTTKDKKRILTTPTVRGELFFHNYAGGKTVPFRCLYNERNDDGDFCIMLDYENYTTHCSIRNNHLDVWTTSGVGTLHRFFPYKSFEVLWCVYDGISINYKPHMR